LPFTLLCDPAREAVERFGVYNRGEKGGIAYPSTFVLERDRRVRFRSLDRTAARVNLDGLFDFLRLGEGAAAPCTPTRCAILPTLQDYKRMFHPLRRACRCRTPPPPRRPRDEVVSAGALISCAHFGVSFITLVSVVK
jgi:hypothetical protein